MDTNLLANRHAIGIILAVGDTPGQTVRKLTTAPSGSPVKSARDHLRELVDAGVLRTEEGTIRGWTAVHVYLTDMGQTIYGLLCVIRGL